MWMFVQANSRRLPAICRRPGYVIYSEVLINQSNGSVSKMGQLAAEVLCGGGLEGIAPSRLWNHAQKMSEYLSVYNVEFDEVEWHNEELCRLSIKCVTA